MGRREGKIPIAAALQPDVSCTVSGSNAGNVLQDEQDLEHDCHCSGPSFRRFQDLNRKKRSVSGSLIGNKSTSGRKSSNLRKSLAWDKAFSINEGVLDVDELPLVNKTPRKPLESHPLDIQHNRGLFSASPFVVLQNLDFNTRAVDCAEGNTSSSGKDLLNSPPLENASPKCSGLPVTSSDLDTKASKFENERSVSGGKIITVDVSKGTRLRLSSTCTFNRGKSDVIPKPVSALQGNFRRRDKSSSSVLSPSASSAYPQVSSASKNAKDTSGKLLPGSQVPPLKSNHENAARNRRGLSSGLRLPSPKIGFFKKQSGPVLGGCPPALPKTILSAALDNSIHAGKGLPPRPQNRFSCDWSRKPRANIDIAKISSQVTSSGIPFAPHLRQFCHSAKGLVSPAPTPSSPHRHRLEFLSAASHQHVPCLLASQIKSGESHSSFSELTTRKLLNLPLTAFPNLKVESRDCKSDQAINVMRPLEIGAEGVVKSLSNRPWTRVEADGKCRTLGEDCTLGKVVDSFSFNTQNLTDQSTRLMERISSDGRRQSLGEKIWEPNDSVFCKEKSGRMVVVDELITSSTAEPLLDTIYHQVPRGELGERWSQDFGRVGSTQLASRPEFGMCSGYEIRGSFVGKTGRVRAPGCGEWHPGIAMLEPRWSLARDSQSRFDRQREDFSKLPESESSVKSDIHFRSSTNSTDFKRQSYTRIVAREDIRENAPDGFVRSLPPASPSDNQVMKHPLAVNVRILNCTTRRTSGSVLRKERNGQVLFDQSSSEVISGQEKWRAPDSRVGTMLKSRPTHSQSKASKERLSDERLSALEAAGQESVLKTSGAVQHSPPNKMNSKPNPWSPVKRSGQELGPFDCTKKVTNAYIRQEETELH